jgi:hypothetical protein
MSRNQTAYNGSAPVGATDDVVDLHLVGGARWCVLDLDEILEGIEFAGLPQRELVCTYLDRRSRRRMFIRVCSRQRKEAAA